MYIVSADQPAQQKKLYDALLEKYDEVVPFVSDPNLELIEKMGMKNGNIAYRGYAVLNPDGKVLFSTKNDYWGEQIDQTFEEISKELD